MKKFVKKEKGITLIALIITIIVMLILVAVTINVALNGGLFDKAKTASDQTQRQVSKEELISAMVGAYDNNGNFVKANVELPEGAKWCNEDETYEGATNNSSTCDWIITETGNKFYIDENGSVLDNVPELPAGESRYDITIGNMNNVTWSNILSAEGGMYIIFFEDAEGHESAFNITGSSSGLDGASYMPDTSDPSTYYRWNDDSNMWTDDETNIHLSNVTYTSGGEFDGDEFDALTDAQIRAILTVTTHQ